VTIKKITFSDVLMNIQLVSGGTDSIPVDSIRKIFIDSEGADYKVKLFLNIKAKG
jgi:hypothetical protein